MFIFLSLDQFIAGDIEKNETMHNKPQNVQHHGHANKTNKHTHTQSSVLVAFVRGHHLIPKQRANDTEHYNDVIMGAVASQITSLTIVYWTVDSDADQRKHQSSASLALCGEFTGDRWILRTKGQ